MKCDVCVFSVVLISIAKKKNIDFNQNLLLFHQRSVSQPQVYSSRKEFPYTQQQVLIKIINHCLLVTHLNSFLCLSLSALFSSRIPIFVTMLPGKSSHAARQVCPWPCISSLPHFHHKSLSHTSNHFTFSLCGRSIKLNFLRAAVKEFRDIWFHWFLFNHPRPRRADDTDWWWKHIDPRPKKKGSEICSKTITHSVDLQFK